MKKTTCATFRLWLSRQIDGTPSPENLPPSLREHVRSCAHCQNALQWDFHLKTHAHYIRNLILPDSVTALRPAPRSKPVVRKKSAPAPRLKRSRLAIAMILTLIISTGISYVYYRHLQRRSLLDAFIQTAIATHRQVQRDRHYDFRTDDPARLETWINQRVEYEFNLPRTPDSIKKPYTLEGTRILPFHGHSAVYIGYHMNNRLISLLAIPSVWVKPRGNRVARIGTIDFYIMNSGPYRIITWAHQSMTYVQISPIQVKDEKSCSFCHPSGLSGFGKSLL